jgi:hypothetical protein
MELGEVPASGAGRNGGNVGMRMKKERLPSLRNERRAREMRGVGCARQPVESTVYFSICPRQSPLFGSMGTQCLLQRSF